MKIAKQQRQYESNITGQKKSMGFAPDAASHLAELMSNSVYSDKYGSIIREVVSNAIDATKEAGSKELVTITIEAAAQMSEQVSTLTVRDYGLGITPDRMDNIFTQYFASTKRDTNEQIGGFGIGAKSPFAYTPLFFVQTHIDGVTRKYILEKTESDRTCTLMDEYEEATANGTSITIPIHSSKAEKQFIKAIQKQLVFLSDKVTIYVPHKYNFKMPKVVDYGSILCISDLDYDTYDSESRYTNIDGIMICLGDIYYEIPAVDDRRGSRNFAIKFPIGALNPTLSRESIEINDTARKLISDKLDEIDILFETWRVDQSKPVFKMEDILNRNNRYVVYPESDITVYSGKDMGYNGNQISVRTVYEGWPEKISYYSSIIDKIITCKSYKRDGKWTSSKVWDFSSTVIRRTDWKIRKDNYQIMIKGSDFKLGTIGKEYISHKFPNQNVMLLNVERDIKSVIIDVCGKHDFLNEEALNAATKALTRTLNEYFKRKCIRLKDYQPDDEWLEARKVRIKNERVLNNTWTKEALQIECPVKKVWAEGKLTREIIKYEDVKKHQDRYIFMPYQLAKTLYLSSEPTKPVTIYAASVPNLKKLTSLGANVWDENRLAKHNTREYSKHEIEILRNSLLKAISRELNDNNQSFVEFIDSMISNVLPNCTESAVTFGYTKAPKYYWEIEKQSMDNGVYTIDGTEYNVKKIARQVRLYKKRLCRSIAGKVLCCQIYSFDRPHLEITPSEYKNLFHTLIK